MLCDCNGTICTDSISFFIQEAPLGLRPIRAYKKKPSVWQLIKLIIVLKKVITLSH